MLKVLWGFLIVGQLLSAGNMNYQQERGYYEINPAYTKHPSKERVYLTKTLELGLLYTATKIFPKHQKTLLIAANAACWGFIIYDRAIGIDFKFRW